MNIVTLIPAYKPHFFDAALDCLENQTVLPNRIIISDDSVDSGVQRATRNWLQRSPNSRIASRIECISGPRQGAHANTSSLLSHQCVATHDYFHVYFDDDVLADNFYACHRAALTRHPGRVSVSKRNYVDSSGSVMNVNYYPSFINDSQQPVLLIDECSLYESTIPTMTNWLGELTNCVFPVEAADALVTMFFVDGICYYGLGDIGAALRLSAHQDVLFVNRYLSGFRQSNVHTTALTSSPVGLASLWAWWALGIHALRSGHVSPQGYEDCVNRIRRAAKRSVRGRVTSAMRKALTNYRREPRQAEDDFLLAWEDFLCSFPEGHLAVRGQPLTVVRPTGPCAAFARCFRWWKVCGGHST